MADDKIVTRKTAAKKPARGKTTAPQVSTSKAAAQPASGPSAAKKMVSPATAAQKAPDTKKTSHVEPAAKKATTRKKTPVGAETRSAHRGNPGSLKQLATVTPEQKQKMIEEAAFYKAEKRNFAPGHEQEDWTDAEHEIDELIARAKAMTGA
jgi:hypothetical protein